MKNRPTTYAKHVGRVPGPDDVQLDIFATAAPEKPRRRNHHARRSRMAPSPLPQVATTPGWLPMAVEAVRRYVATTLPHQNFTIEEIREKVEAGLPVPVDLRAWGHVPRICCASGFIEKKKGVYRPAKSSNGSPKQVYVRGANA